MGWKNGGIRDTSQKIRGRNDWKTQGVTSSIPQGAKWLSPKTTKRHRRHPRLQKKTRRSYSPGKVFGGSKNPEHCGKIRLFIGQKLPTAKKCKDCTREEVYDSAIKFVAICFVEEN